MAEDSIIRLEPALRRGPPSLRNSGTKTSRLSSLKYMTFRLVLRISLFQPDRRKMRGGHAWEVEISPGSGVQSLPLIFC